MTDTITESFCERCGARYAFEQNAEHRRGGIGRVRVLTRGLKNYVANDGMPMSEAMAAAQHDEARTGVSRQLDAFHRTFNFCMSCRQYTCANCWNAKVGECLTCAPDLSREVLPAPFPDLPLDGPAHGDGQAPDEGTVVSAGWPTADLARLAVVGAEAATSDAGPSGETAAVALPEAPGPIQAVGLIQAVGPPPAAPDGELTATELAAIESALAAGHPVDEPAAELDVAPAAQPEPAVVEAAETPVATPTTEPTPVAAAEPDLESAAIELAAAVPLVAAVAPEPGAQPARMEPQPAVVQPVEPAERATAAQQQTRSLLRRFRPAHRPAEVGPDAASAAAAATAATAATRRDDGTLAAVEPAPVPATEEMAAAAAEPTPQPELAAPPVPEPPAVAADAPAPADAIEQPTWRLTAPEAPVTPPASWPDAPAWPTAEPGSTQAGPLPGSAAAPWASRLATARPEPTSVWAASSQEVLAAPGPSAATRAGTPAIQACVSCGLSLSANARFCRRCGSRQG
jgi:ribosomal protein L40E